MLRRVLWFVCAVALVAGAAGLWLRSHLRAPFKGFAGDEVFVDLPPGTSVQGIAVRLTDAGVIPDTLTFRVAARLMGSERHLQAGEYRFTDPASPYDVVARLARGDTYAHAITFPEGLTIREMAVIFEKSGLGTADDFIRAAADSSALEAIDAGAPTLEGYLFPDTYAWSRHTTAGDAVAAMVARFTRAFDARVRAAAEADGLTPRQVVTLASIIEKETASADERPLISAVYRNRLRIGMPLQCDPTVIYALMRAGRWNGNLTHQDLQIDSPYNTYRYRGLPPGPVAAPGGASLVAAVEPASVPYLYFVSRNDGTHVFATTLAEHSRNVAKWQVQYFNGSRLGARGSR
jgi:UPF0755 protein